MNHTFVVPPLDGPLSGGTLYNRSLIAALQHRGATVQIRRTPPPEPGWIWVDSLFLDRVPEWARGRSVGLLTHYLPSLVERGALHSESELQPFERDALQAAHALVVPSPYLRDVVRTVSPQAAPIAVVVPGVSDLAQPSDAPPSGPFVAVIVANVTPGKGILELLQALGTTSSTASWTLRIVGGLEFDPDYAARCQEAAAALPGVVEFMGAMSHPACLRVLRSCHLLVSSSSMESYGMALADARACGVPILARRGGNVDNLVDPSRGGVCCSDVRELAARLVELVEVPQRWAELLQQARRPIERNTWDGAAEAFEAFAHRVAGRRSERSTRRPGT